MTTASQLFSSKEDSGPCKCYYCGANCSGEFKSADFVKDTFTNRDIVMYPRSQHVCNGCVESLGSGEDIMPMIDGSTKIRENDRGMCPRMYSWVITKGFRLAGTKAHIKQFRETLLNPPEPPFAIVLAESGQKQLIFRTPVSMDRNAFPILLEDERIDVVPDLLATYIDIAKPLIALFGKPAMLEAFGHNKYIMCHERYGSFDYIENWVRIQKKPLAKLAIWLSQSKKDME